VRTGTWVRRGALLLCATSGSVYRASGGVDELKLGRARESLDTGLLAKRGGAIGDRNDGRTPFCGCYR
jgi:hypothetical protein